MVINNIKEKRKEKKISQQKLAELTEISYSQERNIERNRSLPNIEIVLKMAKIFECTVEELFYIKKD